MMNFARAVKGRQSRSGSLQAIQDQAMTELRRSLNQSEVDALTRRFSPIELVGKIQEVEFVNIMSP